MQSSCIIVIPIYRKPSQAELLSLESVKTVMTDHDLCIAMPEDLDFDPSPLQVVRFDADFFSSIKAYGSLMVNKLFYKTFLEFEYILIYQLDCLVFVDHLAAFCALGYDYVAPLILGRSDGFWPSSDVVGVGGFSLRKVSSFLDVLELIEDPLFSSEAECLAARIERNGAEDMFWSLAAPTILPRFSVASPQVALAFGFEGDPRRSFSKSRRRKPFGCHHWNQLSNFLWYLPWIKLPFGRWLRLVPCAVIELLYCWVIDIVNRFWRSIRGIFSALFFC